MIRCSYLSDTDFFILALSYVILILEKFIKIYLK